ncbi:MAG: peptidylprolyl isomerase [Rhodospirillales bacterium]|nr:peptidylprolyl isomerase [Rhodospirillales bacterium]MBO6786129.1 peptidylprolyl isomerase [Rhodospirillales bacterium]
MLIRKIAAGLATSLVIAAVTVPVTANDDPVVATVNGKDILRSHLLQAHENLPPEYKQVPLEQIYPMLLTSLIDSKLVAQDAKARKLDEEAEFKKTLSLVRDQLLERYAVRKEIDDAVTDEKLRKMYDETVAAGAEEVHARHILVKTADEAVAIIKDLDGGADFAEVAKEKSTGPSGPRGGDLGFFGKGQMVPEFEEAAYGLEVGKHSREPVQTQFGFHVIKVEEKRTATPPSFEESVEELRADAAQAAGSAYVERLRETAKIERFAIDGSKQ